MQNGTLSLALSYMDEVVKEYQEEQEIHVILDNYSTHKKNEEWSIIRSETLFQ